jgi:multiple sugar transport system substrate-binding protein
MTTLRIALRNYADFESALREEAQAFELVHPGVSVELVSQGIHQLHDSALSEGGLKSGTYDLALLVTDWLAEGMARGALEDLARWHMHASLDGWPEGWARSLVRPLMFDGKLSALPWHDGPECLVYRSDIFSDSMRGAAFRKHYGRELAPPATWAQLEETARFLTDADTNLYGTVFAAYPDGHNTLYDFALQVWSRGGELTDEQGKPRLNSPEAEAGLEFYRRVVGDAVVCHPFSKNIDSTQSGDLFLSGEVAMMANWFGFAARAGRTGSPLAGKVAIAPIPTDGIRTPISLSVFWALVIGSGSAEKELAWQFLRFVSAPHRDLARTRHGTVGVRLSTWRDPDLQMHIPVYAEIEKISLGARQLPVGEHMAEFAAIVDRVVTRALSTSDTTECILAEAQQEATAKGLKFQ